jgi:hypothetical protein
MVSEKDPGLSPELGAEQSKELHEAGSERRKELHEQLERRAEASPEANLEKSRQEALEAAQVEKQPELKAAPAERKRDTPKQRKAKQKASFNKTMKETQAQMKPAPRAFSRLIHNKAVEKTSETVGSTVARPNAILAGSFTAFLATLILYVVARHYGYPLTGTETIAAFILGWAIGLLFDYLRVMITGKRA